MVMLCNMDDLKHFWWKSTFGACNPKWPQIQIMATTFIEGVKLINMHESHDHAM